METPEQDKYGDPDAKISFGAGQEAIFGAISAVGRPNSAIVRRMPSARRERTERVLLDALASGGPATRAELSRITGLSRSAVTECAATLLHDGRIVEDAADPSGRGRPAGRLRIARPAGVVLGIDLGHAHVTAAVADADGVVLAERSAELDVDHSPGAALDLAGRLARAVLRTSGQPMSAVTGAAAGIPGPLDIRTQVVRAPTILADWIDIDPAVELRRRLRRPVIVANDADMGAVGERAFGAARSLDDFIYIKASHGVGAGVVLGGRIYRGATGIAGEIGHTQIPGADSWCRCGSRGCLETVVSIGRVRQQLAHVLANGGDPAPVVPPLAELAADSSAARVIADAGRTIGRVVADIVNCLNPAAVLLGGELGTAGEPFVNGVRESIDRYAQPASARAVEVLAGQLGSRAELLGSVAAALAMHPTGRLS